MPNAVRSASRWRTGGVPLSRSIEESFRRQLDALPAETRRLLRLAAADPAGDPSLVWRAAERLGVPAEAATPAADAGLLEFGARVRFRHPLVRSVAYRSASPREATGSHLVPYGALALAATQGREGAVSELIEAGIEEVAPRGDGMGPAIAQRSSAVLYNCLGRYEDALAALQRGAHPERLLFSTWVLPELVEAAARSGNSDCAANALRRLSETTRAGGTDWALGVEARSRALLARDDDAEDLYREAIDRLGRTRARVQLARAHLLYGEWLRRERRRIDAREPLCAAHQMLTTMGADAFADRAGRELLAAGEAVSRRAVETRDALTAQEALIARLACDGLSNPQIGTRLFISPRTVKYHLHKVFAKLDISSRDQLDRVLPSDSTVVPAP